MLYEVKADEAGGYTVYRDGHVVLGAEVVRISFPSIHSHILQGTVHHISGPCVAKVKLFSDEEIDDVAVTFPGVV
jgi:hypothetical protein